MSSWSIRIHLTSGETIETEVHVAADFEEDEVLAAVREQLDGSLEWLTVGSVLLFPSRVAAVELL